MFISDEHTPTVSEDDEADVAPETHELCLEGTLSKWTNYLHGWQNRYLVIRGSTLSYYKSEYDTAFGCRGSVSLIKATIDLHEFDDCRFDVNVNDCIYYLRASDPDERQKWITALEAAKQGESGYGSETHLQKVGSLMSLASAPSLQSATSFKKGSGLKEKLMEMETFRDILCRQVDTLQSFFDSCAEKCAEQEELRIDLHEDDDFDGDDEMDELSATPTPAKVFSIENGHTQSPKIDPTLASSGIDFRGEAITFKATTAGILAILSHCIDVMTKREDQWRRRLEKERERRKKVEEHYKELLADSRKHTFVGGPDYEEGPYSRLKEDEFYDAVESALDQEDEESMQEKIEADKIPPPRPADEIMKAPTHRMSVQVETKINENLNLIAEDVEDESCNWQLVFEDGDMKVYRRELEEDGIVCDPLRATHVVQGVTAREMCHYFYDKDVKMEWESTIEKIRVLESLAENTMILHCLHKRIWPSSQRDTCLLSHIRKLEVAGAVESEEKGKQLADSPWIVCNFSVDHDDAPSSRYVRALANVIMYCQTYVRTDADLQNLSRDDVYCKLVYAAQVNPGGWAPPSVVRTVTKREYPKFLRKFTSFVLSVVSDKDVWL